MCVILKNETGNRKDNLYMSDKRKIKNIKKSTSKERAEKIANGTWMSRGAVFDDKRKKERYNPKHKKDEYTE